MGFITESLGKRCFRNSILKEMKRIHSSDMVKGGFDFSFAFKIGFTCDLYNVLGYVALDRSHNLFSPSVSPSETQKP